MKLAELQAYFARAATSGNGPLPDLEEFFLGSEQLPAKDRLAIYNRGYFYRLLDALASVFGATKRVLGDSDFERLGLSYVARYPSEHPAVERVGRAFASHLRSAGVSSPVVDLAQLEWARLRALVSPNPASVASVDAIDSERFPAARVRLVPSLQRLELDARALTAFNGGDLALREESTGTCGVAVWRSNYAVQHQSLDALEWQALASAESGATLSLVCSVFDSGSPSEDVRQAFRVLSGWFARGWLESVIYDEAPAD